MEIPLFLSIQIEQAITTRKALGDAELLVIHETQLVTKIGLNLKILVDNFPQVQIIATGLASFELTSMICEPLAGRKLTCPGSHLSVIHRENFEKFILE